MVDLAILVQQSYLQLCQNKLFEGSWKLNKMVEMHKKNHLFQFQRKALTAKASGSGLYDMNGLI